MSNDVEVLTSDDQILLDNGYEPGEYRLLSNGAIRGVKENRIVAKLPGKYDITKATASEYHQAAREKRIKIAQEALAAGTGGRNLHESAVILTQAQVRTALESQTVAGVRAYENIMAMAGLWDKSKDKKPESAPGITIDRQSLEVLRDILAISKGNE